jgi:Family of unknown function (DUF6624)
VQRIGWIDVGRFGEKASANAIIIMQHSSDIPLVEATLPLIEKDFARRSDDAGGLYAMVYDGLQLDLGHKQRYGTQVWEDAQGTPLLLPLDDRARVDEFRHELKLPPLADYLQQVSKFYYGGKRAIRLPRDDE